MNDFRFAIRQLLKNPGFAAVASLTLALGIGANTAIFSLIDSVLLRALPYPDSDRLVKVYEAMPGFNRNAVSGGAFKDWRERGTKFSNLAVYEGTEQNLTGAGAPERVAGWKVSSGFLSVLGISPLLGRDFSPGDDRPAGDSRITILTHAYWQARFGGDSSVIGRTLALDQVPYTIVGVLPPRALLNDQVQYLVPTVIDGPGSNWGRAGHFRDVIARLIPGTTVEGAQSELRGIKAQLVSQYPAFKKDWSVLVVPLQEVYASRARPMLLVLLGTVVLVLLIVCANVSNLMLARGSARGREMAIRVALGAGHWRIFRQLLIESLLLAGIGCVAGLLVAQVSIGMLTRFVAGQLPELLQPALDWKLLAFSVVISAGCGLAFGVFPAWRASRADLNQDLKESERGSTSATQRRAQSWLVVSEFALTLVLLIGLFAILAVGLACLGIYGVLAHAIGQRARGFSIRSALGAQRADIVRLVVKGGLQPAGMGIALGLIGGWALTRLVEAQLFEAKARDPLVFAGAVVVLGLVALAVILVPACRAARIDPIKALRHE